MSWSKFLLPLMFLLSACATPNISSDYTPTASPDKSLVVLSLTYSGMKSDYFLYYRKIGEDTLQRFHISPFEVLVPPFRNRDFDQKGFQGEVFTAELPVGDYQLESWAIRSGMISVGPTYPFKVNFQVQPNKAIYVGNFHFEHTARFGYSVTAAKVKYVDQGVRDLKVFRTKYPRLKYLPISSALPSGYTLEDLGGVSQVFVDAPVLMPFVK